MYQLRYTFLDAFPKKKKKQKKKQKKLVLFSTVYCFVSKAEMLKCASESFLNYLLESRNAKMRL